MNKISRKAASAALALSLLIVPAAMFANGQGESAGAPRSVKNYNFGGSTTVEPIMTTAIEAFADVRTDAKISYDAQGSGPGIQGVATGTYSLGGSSRDLTPEELAKGLKFTPIALDGIAIIVNGDVAIDNLSRTDVAKIVTGEVKNWKEVGGPDKPVVLVVRDEASGTRVAVADLILNPEAKAKTIASAKVRADAITTESNGDMVVKVGSTPYAVGYCGLGYLDEARAKGAKAVLVNKIEPTVTNVLNKTYPVSRYLYLVHKGDLAAGSLEKAFVDFILSAKGQSIVAKVGYIALPKK